MGVVPVVVASSTAEEGGRHRAAWRAQDGHGGHSEEQLQKKRKRKIAETPLSPFSLITDWSNSALLNFIEALKHFYKNQQKFVKPPHDM